MHRPTELIEAKKLHQNQIAQIPGYVQQRAGELSHPTFESATGAAELDIFYILTVT